VWHKVGHYTPLIMLEDGPKKDMALCQDLRDNLHSTI
jgi:hypothetical protein